MIVQKTGVRRLILPGWGLKFIEPAGAAAGNGLLNNLIAYWPGNEVNGNALDLHTNALHLTDVNTVTSNPGIVYPLARQYTAATSEYHERPGDDALLSAGDTDFTMAVWCYLSSKGANRTIASKYLSNVGGLGEYILLFFNATDRFVLDVVPAGGGDNIISAVTFGSPALATWHFVVAWHDSVANTINIQVNNGAVDAMGYALGVADTATPFRISRYTAVNYWDGRIGPTMFWKSAAGAGGVLTAAQRTALWNGGLGLPYTSFTI